jgi:hypothetical protein
MVDLRAPAPAKSVTRRPATPRPRSKLGDGTTTRCVHTARDDLLVIVSEATLDLELGSVGIRLDRPRPLRAERTGRLESIFHELEVNDLGPALKLPPKGLFSATRSGRDALSRQEVCSRVPLSAAPVYLEHRVAVFRYSRHGLQHIPVLYNLAVGIKAKDIDACGFPPAEVQIARMHKR